MFCKATSGKKKLFFARRFLTIFKQKCSNMRPLLSITFPYESLKILDIPLREVGAKRPLNGTSKVKKVKKKKLFLARRFRTIFKQKCSYMRPILSILFPKDSESLKILDIRRWEVGAKRPLNGTSKVNRHTDRRTDVQTDRRTDKSTYRKHRPRGPML